MISSPGLAVFLHRQHVNDSPFWWITMIFELPDFCQAATFLM
jgi:hypothetical protein